MNRTRKAIAAAVVLSALFGKSGSGQAPPPATLIVSLENVVEYQVDIDDISNYATNPNVTPSTGAGNFGVVTLLGDIVAVNGQPAKGLYAGRTRVISTTPTPHPGQAIADITRTAIREHIFEILQADGTPVGTIMSLGFSGGQAPPGAPSAERGNWAIVGGTGAFLGARGSVGGTGGVARAASVAEDPANRRTNGGGKFPFILHVIPMFRPEVVSTPAGPAITHSSDFSLLNASKPAAAGEVLSAFVTGLGPTVPGVDPGQPFPDSPPSVVNSPVQVTVSGPSAEVLAAVGFPGTVDGYQVNFRIPPGTPPGPTTIQFTAAWIAGSVVTIPVR